MKCKFCQSPKTVKYGVRRHIQYYLCQSCKRTFSGIDAPEGMRTPTPEIATSLSLFYGGLPLTKIQMQLEQSYLDWVETSTIYRWITKYSKKAEKIVESYKAKTGNTWVVDETVIDIDSVGKTWFFDAICESTRFLLASHISRGRTIKDVEIILSKAAKVANKTPRFIITDGMKAYPEGIEKVFGADAKHIKMKGVTHEININLIERWHSTLKQRTKIMRGLKTFDTARIVLNGFILDYNFFRPHMALEGKTPAYEAKIYLPFANWEGVVRYQS